MFFSLKYIFSQTQIELTREFSTEMREFKNEKPNQERFLLSVALLEVWQSAVGVRIKQFLSNFLIQKTKRRFLSQRKDKNTKREKYEKRKTRKIKNPKLARDFAPQREKRKKLKRKLLSSLFNNVFWLISSQSLLFRVVDYLFS